MMDHKRPPLRPNHGLFYEIQVRARLILRLMLDWRINIFFKLIPVAAIVYVLLPYNIPGPFDDLFVFLFGMYLFIEICPKPIVQQHLNHIRGITPSQQDPDSDEEVIDAEYKVLEEYDPDTHSAGKKR